MRRNGDGGENEGYNVTMRHPPAQPSGSFDREQSFLESTLSIARSISSARSKQTRHVTPRQIITDIS